MSTAIARTEYPRPQMIREDWLCLNGKWDFTIDHADTGLERGLLTESYDRQINVPFCPESELSGIEYVDFMQAVWYRRKVSIPQDWQGRRILLHFQAVDDEATVWANGKQVGRHHGGWTPFTCDLTDIAKVGEDVEIVLRARELRVPKPQGKQSNKYENFRCLYTRTTGIWQTVWMEPVPITAHLNRPRITPDLPNSRFVIEQPVQGQISNLKLRVTVKDQQGDVCCNQCKLANMMTPTIQLDIPSERLKLWAMTDPHLYDMLIELLDSDGKVVDTITSYAGMRSVSIEGKAILINGKHVFQRLVLDQGYYPKSIMTAPDDQALIEDIQLSINAGFNGARLHQKVFEERFLYHADRMGYLVWGEFPDWGYNRYDGHTHMHDELSPTWIAQWIEAVMRDYSHPCIVGWCPLNETSAPMDDRIRNLDDVTYAMYHATKFADPTRPVVDASGYSHRVVGADIYDSHDYEQDACKFAQNQAGLAEDKPHTNGSELPIPWSIPYAGQPFFVSEFGGIWWNPIAAQDQDSWGYGQRPANIDEFYDRFEGLCHVLLDNPDMFGYCYTQLTDVFQEQNGIYYFDRSSKFDMARIRAIQTREAAIERQRKVD
ncbi:MAG TPA: beta-galactosidase [Phycisphaerales bacterium]|nr:beta-galactosidase [Phycisphaerales bacterium]|tara:strand:- start:131252 stop:133060 length:1809 start_codon:yes stop_codon:yes gene_type:complete